MKKTIALFLAVMVLTNFHCTRLQINSDNPETIQAACRAYYVDAREENGRERRGILYLMNDSIQFKSKKKTMMFFYEDVSSVNIEQRQRSIFPKMAGPNFTEKKAGAFAYFIILGIFFGILAGLWFSFLGLSIESDVGVKINQPEESDPAIFRIAKREFMKIHTLLNEKSHVSLDILEEVPAPIF